MSDHAALDGDGDDDAGLVKEIANSEAIKSWKQGILTCMIVLATGWSRRVRSAHDPQPPRRRALVVVSILVVILAGMALNHSHPWVGALFRLLG
jgi:hypothetical protein